VELQQLPFSLILEPNSYREMALQINDLVAGFQAVGIKSGIPVLVHSSLSSLGKVEGGPDTVIDALVTTCGPDGTLCLPTLSYLYTTPSSPTFDVRTTPTNLGAIPETFRRRPFVQRSVHPTHSVSAVGPQADAVLGRHHLDTTPVGENSPFRRVRDLRGQVGV
jgi:aminoglycoside 3-N-acetyltransferase